MNERTANGNGKKNEERKRKSLIEKNHLSFFRCALCDPNLFLNWSNVFFPFNIVHVNYERRKKKWKKNEKMCNMCKFSNWKTREKFYPAVALAAWIKNFFRKTETGTKLQKIGKW